MLFNFFSNISIDKWSVFKNAGFSVIGTSLFYVSRTSKGSLGHYTIAPTQVQPAIAENVTSDLCSPDANVKVT